FFQAEDGIRDRTVTGVQTCALPIGCPLRQYRLTRLRPLEALFPRSVATPATLPHRCAHHCSDHRDFGVVLVSTFSRSTSEAWGAMNRGIISLLIIFLSGALYALTPNQWQFRQAIEVLATGLAKVNLSAE